MSSLLLFRLLPLLVFGGFGSSLTGSVELWVSPEGSASPDGSPEAPFGSIHMAQREARELRRLSDPAVEGGIRILLKGGLYRLEEPLFVRWEDSGTAGSPTVFAAAPGEVPVISGGVPVEGWKPADSAEGMAPDAHGKVWVADAPQVGARPLFFRDFWVGGQRAQRAREVDDDDFARIVKWDKARREAWIPAHTVEALGEPGGLELVIHQMWAIAILRVKTIEIEGELAKVSFHEPENRVQFEHPWPPVVISEEHGNSIFYLTNRREFLDQPGEWYQDPGTGKVYYWPREGEQPGELDAVAPVFETLVRVEGTADRPVGHVHFEGLHFQHTTWMRPSEAGHVPLQAGFYMYDAYKLRPAGTPDKASLENQAWVGRKPAGVELRHVRETRFEGCFFEHMAASALDYVIGSEGDEIVGNVFRDIGGNGFVAGGFQEEGVETHVPYNPSDERLIVQDFRFANNLLTDIANQDWGGVAVIAGYVRDAVIEHNEISDVAYTGISVGWGWTPEPTVLANNRIRGNHIHHFAKRMYDTAAIYTLSAQPGTVIAGNAVHSINRPGFVHDPYHWAYIYLDEGSSEITVSDNWTEQIKFTTNATGPGNVWKNTGPDAVEVRATAGLQEAYRHLLQFSPFDAAGDAL